MTPIPNVNEHFANDLWNEDNQQLINKSLTPLIPRQPKPLTEGLKSDQKQFSDDQKKLDIQKPTNLKLFTFHNAVICVLLMILILLLSVAFFQKDFLRYMVSRLTQPKIQVHLETQPATAQPKKPKCKNDLNIFRVYYNQNDKEMKKIGELMLENQDCDYPVYGFQDLEEINEKWNSKYPNSQIDPFNINEDWQKRLLIALQKLYFQGGVYIDPSIPVWKVGNRALKYTLSGFDPIFAYIQGKNQKGIYIPDPKKFIKVRTPYSPVVREMIMKIAKNQDFLDKCRQKQCIIVR